MQVPNACVHLNSIDAKKLNLKCATEQKRASWRREKPGEAAGRKEGKKEGRNKQTNE